MRRSSPQRHSSPFRVVTRHHSGPSGHGHMQAEVRLANGIRLCYLEQGDRAGRAVIMLHGLADSSFSFSRLLPHLSRVHRVLVPDLRGHGDSERPPEGYRPRDLAEDVLGLLDALGIERATLVGHSMGTFVAQRVALAAPQRVSGLVLIASATTARNEVMLELLRSLAGLPESVPEEFAREGAGEGVARRAGGADGRDAVHRPGRGPDPVLLLWGERDGIFTRAEQEALVELFPVASLKMYRETGHAPHWERPREVAHDLERFLRTTLG
jgi:non-heme chloroperoxidase